MLVLPLIYAGFVGLLSWATCYHAFHDWKPIMHLGGFTGGGYIVLVKLLIYIVPLFVGVVVVFFMFKPLLAGRPKRAQPLALNPADNPLLYAFIAKICDAVGAPSPRRIDMDCELNASASFRRGFRSLASNDFVLTIGLPLVANCSTRELAGVIAHEFGHFTQGAGMRLCYIIRSIKYWFARVAHERDAWDIALQQWSNEVEDGRVAIIVWSVQIAVWFSRRLLALLALTGHIIAGFMLRQMEYDADACQIKIVGSETFEATHRKLATLSAALEETCQQINTLWKKTRQLPDNLSELVRQAHENLPPKILQQIEDSFGLRRISLFDTHPSPADRIRRARMAGDPGIFHDDRPATQLFAHFEHPARFVTLLHYTDDLGIPITNQMLLHVESTQPKTAQGYAAASNAGDELFLGLLPLLLPLHLEPPSPSANPENDLAELEQLSGRMQQLAEQVAPLAAQYADASQKWLNTRAARRLLEMNVSIRPEAFGLAASTPESAQAAETEASSARESLRHAIREVAAAMLRRVQLALAVKLAEGEVSGENPVAPEQIHELVTRLNRNSEAYRQHEECMNLIAMLDLMNGVKNSMGETPALSRALAAQTEAINTLFAGARDETAKPVPKPGLQLQISRQQNFTSANDVESFRQKTIAWLAAYRQDADQLAEIVLTAGQIAA